nr:IS110 family transposase [Mycobacterium gordonae]
MRGACEALMVVIGVDTHKKTHTLVGVDPGGRKLGELTVPATTAGHRKAFGWARESFEIELTWGIEDCRNLSRRLEQDLLDAGQRVVRVPPHLMARTRASARTRGKSDPIDALAVARAVLREPDLPMATHDEVSRELKLLVDRREDLVSQRSATTNRFLWRVHELDPSHAPKSRSLDRTKTVKALHGWLTTQPGLVAELARQELSDITRLTLEIEALESRIGIRVRTHAPSLLGIYGCAELTAAKIVGETADVSRFRSEAAFASYAGLAPTPRWSGQARIYMVGSRSGNRQLNTALYRIALVQISHPSAGRSYYEKRCDAHQDSPTEAIRRLKRRIARTVFARLRADRENRPTTRRPLTSFPELEQVNAQWADALAGFGVHAP